MEDSEQERAFAAARAVVEVAGVRGSRNEKAQRQRAQETG